MTKDLIDQGINIVLNFSQSGHPGCSRSKVHAMVVTLLSGAMRWDIRELGKIFADRYVLWKYSINPDFDNRWRNGGSLRQLVKESTLDPDSLWDGIRYIYQ